jgi:hypothetical protein
VPTGLLSLNEEPVFSCGIIAPVFAIFYTLRVHLQTVFRDGVRIRGIAAGSTTVQECDATTAL